MKYSKNNRKYFFIYLSIILLFTTFYLVLFIANRLQYTSHNLEVEHEKIMNAVDTIADIDFIANKYQLLYFMDYVALLESFYKNNKKSLRYFLNKNTMYASISIVDKNAKPIFAKVNNLDFTFDISSMLYGDGIKTTIMFDNDYDKVYRIFVHPIDNIKDTYIVAYLDIDELYGADDFYIVSREGRLLSKSKEKVGFDNFALHYPNAWEHITDNHSGQYIGDNHIFTYHTLNHINSINGVDIEQNAYYLIFAMQFDSKDNPYSIDSISSFIKYADFHSNIIYWIIGYVWIFFTSIVVLWIIINKIKNTKSFGIDEKYRILDIDSGYSKVERFTKKFSASGFMKIFVYLVSIFIYFKRPINSIYFCKVCINGLKQISINLDNKHRDEIVIKTIKIIKHNLTKDEIIIRLSFDEFLIVFIDKDIDFINDYYSYVSSNFTSKKYYNDFKHTISVSHGIVKYVKKEDIYDCINKASRIANIEKNNNEINLFFN